MSDRARTSPPDWDTGVRHRMRSEQRRISSQHTQLNDLYLGVASSLERSGVHTARVAFTRFADALDYVATGGRIVLAGVKGFKAIPDFISDKIVMKEISIQGAIGVTSSGYRSAIRLLEARRHPVEKMHTHDFGLRDAETAIRTLAREIPGEESIHSCLIPET